MGTMLLPPLLRVRLPLVVVPAGTFNEGVLLVSKKAMLLRTEDSCGDGCAAAGVFARALLSSNLFTMSSTALLFDDRARIAAAGAAAAAAADEDDEAGAATRGAETRATEASLVAPAPKSGCTTHGADVLLPAVAPGSITVALPSAEGAGTGTEEAPPHAENRLRAESRAECEAEVGAAVESASWSLWRALSGGKETLLLFCGDGGWGAKSVEDCHTELIFGVDGGVDSSSVRPVRDGCANAAAAPASASAGARPFW
mmetsp:Transcript_60022/g.172289  ORF Transcript_60022/g.172289 Transcript_60022/m.172289 type:complete len:257 (-) Transcript_60022:142-912(-)